MPGENEEILPQFVVPYITFHEMMAMQCQMGRVGRELKKLSVYALALLINSSPNSINTFERNEMADGHDMKEDYNLAMKISCVNYSNAMTHAMINYGVHKAELIKDKRIYDFANPDVKNARKKIKNLCRDIVNTTMMLASIVAIGQCYRLKTDLLVDSIISPKIKLTKEALDKNKKEFQESILSCPDINFFFEKKELENIWKKTCEYMERLAHKYSQLRDEMAKEE